MNGLKRRGLALLLCLCMVLSFLPVSALADEVDNTETVTAVEDVKYTVNHSKWDWDLEDYVLLESEELTGKPGEQTNAQAKEFEGLILMDEIAQVEIAADGTTVVEVYYVVDLEATAYVQTSLYDTSVSSDYFKVISANTYDLAPGAVEHEIVLNNAEGNDRKVAHVFEVDTKNEDLEVMPGYYGIDKLNPDDLSDSTHWTDKQLSQTVKYYEDELGYNVVGAMNTALAYDSNAPYGYMVWNGVVLGSPKVHSGAQTYLAIDWDGNCELRSMSTPLNGTEKTAIPANFGWLVKNGVLTATAVERTSSDASRSMVGVKADGTLIFCLVDGRNGAISSGLSNYEMGEMMLALGCVNAFNGDGGGSSTFISKRAGESVNTMRSVPSDGSERATINSVILVSTAGATGIFDKTLIETEYDYIAPTASMTFSVTGLDTKGFTMDVPAEVTYQIKEEGMGSVVNGVYNAGAVTGTATIQAVYNGNVVGEKVLNVVHPEEFGFTVDDTVLPYTKTMDLIVVGNYGDDNWSVCIDGAYSLSLSDSEAAVLDGIKLTATDDESINGVQVFATYTPDTTKTHILTVTYGKGSEIFFDFEDGDISNFMGVDEMKAWAQTTGAPANIFKDSNFSEKADAETFLATAANGQVKNGEYALGVTLDYTDAEFAGWAYNMFFYTGEQIVLRDVANGNNATTLGMWVYIPEGAAGLAMQIQGTKVRGDVSGGTGAHFYFKTTSGAIKNLNSCTEADIPASRWVYATVDLTQFGDYFATYNPMAANSRSPSFIRFYVKPMTAANLTFYFDDFTLDYSTAVEDRLLPTINNIEYAVGDTAAELANDAVINSGSAAFSAVAEDVGAAGLNIKSAQIFLDGNPVDTQVSGKKMVTVNDLMLSEGPHTVTFEIADNLGNYAQVSKTFTVKTNNEAEHGIVYLDGHNDSGLMPEYDSVYYVDIKTTDAAAINYVEANIQLNTANQWELEHMIAAPGYEVEYIQLDAGRDQATYGVSTDIHSVENVVAIMLTRTEDCTLSGEQTLLSIPVRLWSWDGVDHVTGKPVDRETQFATGYCPIVKVEYSVLFGYVETTDGDVTFGGSVSVETMMNDDVNPWHYHDAELTVLHQAATCTAAGYENRTYCETCKSVIDWGTKIEATGHNYVVADDQLLCTCGDALNATGLVSVGGKIYCMIGGKLVTGWQNIDGKWCYADATTKEVKTGQFAVDKITYTADENGLLVGGAWVEDYLGRRYSYGPQFATREWVTIDGEEYYFAEKTGYALTGYHTIPDNRNNPNSPVRWYHFAEDGKLLERMTMTGVLDTGDGLFYMEEGCVKFVGMVKVGDDYYCVADKNGSVLTGYQWVGSYIMANSRDPMANGYYEFGVDGKMLQGIVAKEDGTYYYEMGKPVDAGWVKDGNDYYVFTNGGKALTGRNWVGTYLTETSKDPYKVGNFIFAQDGKLANGVVETDDGWYYCVAGVGKEAGLVQVDGQFYYADVDGKLATGRIWVGTYPSHGLLPKGYYEFGADGKMLNGVVEKADGTYYYEMGQLKDTGWLKVGDDYYVFTNGGKALTGANWVGSYLTETSRDPYMKGNFFFMADGKLAGGVVEMEDGYYYYEKGVAKEAGLIQLDGVYYLAEKNGKLATGRVWVGTYASNGLLNKGYYEFGADGAMLQGVVEREDGLYYYDLGNTKYLGLIERDGEYYYVNEGGKLEIGRVWVGTYASNGIVSKGYYEFGADGAMLNGFEYLSDGLYYYTMGVAQYHGLKVIDDNLYYIEEGGKVMTGTVWIGTYASNGLLPKGNYTFAEDGKFVG